MEINFKIKFVSTSKPKIPTNTNAIPNKILFPFLIFLPSSHFI